MSKHDEMVQMHDLTMQTMANNRRSKARGQAIQAHAENLDLRQREADLHREIEALREAVTAATSVVRKLLVSDTALRTTITHLRDAWKSDAPASTARLEIENTIGEFYNHRFNANAADPQFSELAEHKIQNEANSIKQAADLALPGDDV